MKTPFGVECPYFYGDYYRGKNVEECRLIENQGWTKDLCRTCPVPEIKRANSCPYMTLIPTIKKGVFGINRRVTVTAFCSKSNGIVKTPEVGCGICHPISGIFEVKK